MSKLKKLSFVLIFGLTLLAGFFGLSLSPIKVKNVEAESEKVELVVKKVQYSSDNIKNDDGLTKKLGEYTPEELYLNYKNIIKDKYNENSELVFKTVDVSNGEVVSINPDNNEAVLVYLRPTDGTSIIRQISSANIQVSTESKHIDYNLTPYYVSDSSENLVCIASFDFSKLKDSLSSNYNTSAHFSFTFNCQYSTTGTNSVTYIKTFDFYLIDENEFFDNSKIFTTENATLKTEDNIKTYFHNKQKYSDNPTLIYDPFKFSPTIVYSYNETSATIETQTEYNSLTETYKFNLISSNQNLFENKTLCEYKSYTEVDNPVVGESYYTQVNGKYSTEKTKVTEENKDSFEFYSKNKPLINLELDRIGKYTISYQLVINENNEITKLDTEKTQNIEKLNAQTLYLFGYEALYKNYQETNQEIINLNQNYNRLFNEYYRSDFSNNIIKNALNDFSTEKIDEAEIILEKIVVIENYLKDSENLNNLITNFDIASTNQAPIKLNGYVTENLSGARYYLITKTDNSYSLGEDAYNFTPSKRFESEGLYCVIIPYKFSTLSDNIYFSVMLFEIEKSTPQISFYNGINENETFDTDKLLNANGFTNQNVFVVWNNEKDLSPFSYPSNIKFVKNNQILTINENNINLTSDGKQKYVIFEEDGEYLVQLTYGTQQITIEKKFVKDASNFEFKVVEAINNDQNNSYDLSDTLIDINSTNESASNKIEATTSNNFAIFVKNKEISSNTISVKYDYISLDSVTAQKQFEIINENDTNKLLIYNNYRLSNLVSNLTYSNLTLNNLTNLNNLEISSTNSTAVISINALYKFTISDLAGNTKSFFILRDNTENVVLESNSLVEIGTANKDKDGNDLASSKKSLIETSTNKEAVLKVKDTQTNLVSNNYSIIFGDYKALEFKVTSDNLNFAKEYFDDQNLTCSENENENFKYLKLQNIITKIESEFLGSPQTENLPTASDVKKATENNNIFTINVDENTAEVDLIITLSLSNGTKREFEFNTDRNQVLIFGKQNGEYSRIYQSNPTNLENVYITYVNKVNNDGYDLESLTLSFYSFITKNNEITFADSPEEYDLLASSQSGSVVCDSISYGENVISPLATTYENGVLISKEGKYVITKTYKKGTTSSQTFYVDRKNPISYFEDILIGNNIDIKLDGKTLSAKTIYNYISNNLSIKTNMLNFVWENSEENLDFVYKYPNLSDAHAQDKNNLKLNFALVDNNNNELITSVNTKLTSDNYTLIIFDNTFRFNQNNELTYENIKKHTNYAEINLSIDKNKPTGNFIKENGEQVLGSTNTNKLSFEFELNESEFMYDINLENIVLKQNGSIIFKTITESEFNSITLANNQTKGYFNLSDGSNNQTVFYISFIGDAFTLTREKVGAIYRYKLTILDPTKANQNLFEGETSIEALYNIELSLNYDSSTYSLDFGTSNLEIEIDHTAPVLNFIKYLENDKFLTDEEKESLKQSFVNKSTSEEINFDNYTFVISSVPEYFNETDTNLIYIRNYTKYDGTNIANEQSLVSGDPRFDDQTITSRYRFDVNTYIGTQKLYSPSQYNNDTRNKNTISTSEFFTSGEGFYEIIEVDEAGNYSVYTVYYTLSPTLSAEYSLSSTAQNETKTTESSFVETQDPEFKLHSINSSISNDFLQVSVMINENNENSEVFVLRYLPFNLTDTEIEYFSSQSGLINRVNQIIENYNTLNEYGNVYKIVISTRQNKTLTIINSTPNKEFEIKNYLKNYDNNKIVLTIPNSQNNATYIKTLKVYPVVGGEKGDKLNKDSTNVEIPESFEQNKSYVFTFNNTYYYIENSTEKNGTANIYYFEWTDNFGRTQSTVRYLGEKNESKFTFDDNAQFVTKNGENYTQNNSGIYFEYSPNLYSIKIEYQLLPSTNKFVLYPYNSNVENDETPQKIQTAIENSNSKLDLFSLYLISIGNYETEIDYQIKFIVTLTDLTKIGEEQNTETYSYIFYPLMPSLDFTDSSSNVLSIKANDEQNIVSTSKNVHLSYINSTLFDLSSIVVTRTYVDSTGKEQTETFNISKNEYTFSQLGQYKIVVTNGLGKTQNYQFNITTKTNKTYSVETNEQNMTNFELSSCGTTEIEIDNVKQTFETYLSIFNAKVVVNSDFNLTSKQIASPSEFSDYTLYQILKNDEPFKYIAIKKVDYNSNFLNLNDEINLTVNETTGSNTSTNLAENLTKGFTITSTQFLKITAPLYNENIDQNQNDNTNTARNKIIIKVYYNNELIELNANIYETDETNNTQTLTLDGVPSGVYSIYFEDIAGNTQLFNGNSFLNLNILNEVAVNLNGKNPVDYQIYNSNVVLSIVNEKQYLNTSDKQLKVTAYLNNQEITKINKDENKNYIFSDYGFYKVTIEGYISSASDKISKTLYFTILNPNEALKEYSFMSLNGQNITKILRDGTDVTTEIKRILALFPVYGEKDSDGNVTYSQTDLEKLANLLKSDFEKSYLYNLTLKSEIDYTNKILYDDINENNEKDAEELYYPEIQTYIASGNYEIFVTTQNLILGSTDYSFKLWIRDADAKININSTLENDGTTSKAITLTYNPYLIYTQIGECNIYVGSNIIAQINAESLNEVNSYVIPKSAKGTFIIQVKSSSGNVEYSLVLNKTEPLSTVSIILIVVACIVVAGGIFLFIKLRTRMKVK